jgi:hypothetical protein
MDIMLRLLIGIPILFISGMVSYFVLAIVSLVVSAMCFGMAKIFRRLLGVNGSWESGGQVAIAIGQAAKALTIFCFGVSVVLYSFLFPIWGAVSTGFAAASVAILVLLWGPSLFFAGLFLANFGGENVRITPGRGR